MTYRTFRVATAGGQAIIYDPVSGATRRAPHPLPAGRRRLDRAAVRRWPLIHPAETGLTVPVSLCWSPLVRCNLACPHCLDDTSLTALNAAARIRIARLIAASGVLGVDISGGEPLLLRGLPQLAHDLASGGCAVSITTNGWHLARRIDDLAGCADAIRVSLDAPAPGPHDAVRGDGSFARAIDGIAACRQAGVPVQVQAVLMAATARHAQALADLAAKAGADGITFLQMLPIGRGTAVAAQMLTDTAARQLVAGLHAPPGLDIRLRTREDAAGFTVVRADGRIWRNDPAATAITPATQLRQPGDLALHGRDGSA
jgi:MoaA/NifB/PqqE/SkfB family radical SAM enzyme